MIDWSRCPDAERTPGKVSGAWCVKGTRIPVQAILDNAAAGCRAEQIATEIFDLPVNVVRRILRFAYRSEIEAIQRARRTWPALPASYQAREEELIGRFLALRGRAAKDKLTAADIEPESYDPHYEIRPVPSLDIVSGAAK